jgi:hypothetical protein
MLRKVFIDSFAKSNLLINWNSCEVTAAERGRTYTTQDINTLRTNYRDKRNIIN